MPDQNPPRVVIDTNILISAIIVAGNVPDKIIKAWKDGLIILLLSGEILEEIKEVAGRDKFKKKYQNFGVRAEELIEVLELATETVDPKISLPIHCRDAKDDKLLTAALGGEADYLVTFDEDLLDLNGNPALGDLIIVYPNEFYDKVLREFY